MADWISATGRFSSFTGFEAWINPHLKTRDMRRLFFSHKTIG